MTTRRTWLFVIGALATTRSGAQVSRQIPRVGYLSTGSLEEREVFLSAFMEGLRELGYVDGKNIVVSPYWAGDTAAAFPRLATSLVLDRSNAIVTTCVPSTRAAKNATRTIPIVMSIDEDPVAAGLVTSLARPGANVTGTANLFEELIPKWLELLSATIPSARDFGILSDPVSLSDPYMWVRFEAAAQRLGINVIQFGAHVPADIDSAFASMRKQKIRGLVVMIDAFLAGQVTRIVTQAERDRLPAMYGYREFAEAGGLMSYGLSFREYYKGVAKYVDAVLKGTKPADLPVERPTRIGLVVNLKTAKTLDLTIPPSVLLRADRLLE